MGKIRDLRLQANFTLVEGYTTIEGERIKPMVYRADFVYARATGPDCNGTVHWLREVEDAKGVKTKDYLLKKKLMQDKYGITIREV
nr:MAG TPA: Endonuclease [Caudoviricetes sp.]